VCLNLIQGYLGDCPPSEPGGQVASDQAADNPGNTLRCARRIVANRRDEPIELARLVERAGGLLN